MISVKKLLWLALALPCTMHAAGKEERKSPHHKHSKSPERHHKHTKTRTLQDKALHDAQEAMNAAKKKLDDAIANERQAQQEKEKAENKYNYILPKTEKARQQRQHEFDEQKRIEQETLGEIKSESEKIKMRKNIIEKYKILNDFRTARNNFFIRNSDLTYAKEAVADAEEKYKTTQTNYKTLLTQTQKTQTQK